MSKVFIKPTKSNKPHFIGARRYKSTIDHNGVERELEPLKNDISRFPGSKSKRRIKWNISNKRWDIDMSGENLNNFVKATKLKYLSGPNVDKLIETADVFDPSDAFFNHPDVAVMLYEGYCVLNTEVPKDNIIISGFRADKSFSSPNRQQSINTRFIISNSDKDVELEYQDTNYFLEAITAYMGLPANKKVAYAIGLGLPVTAESSPDLINTKMREFLQRDVINERGKSNSQLFLELVNSKTGSEDLEISALITRAKKASVLRFTKNDGFKYNGETVAIDTEGLIKFLKDPNNRDIMEAIIQATNEKQ